MKKRSGRPDRYTKVSNATADDTRLDVLAFGLHTIFVRCMDGYDINVDEIARRRGPDRRKLYPAMRLLVELGYVMRVKFQDQAGHWQTEVIVFDTPAEADEGFTIAYEYLNRYRSVRIEPAQLDPRGKSGSKPEPTSNRRDVGGDQGKRPSKKAKPQVATDIQGVRPAGDRQVGNREANKEDEVGSTREEEGADGRRPTTCSSEASDSGFAAPAEQRDPEKKPMPWGDIRAVLAATPAPLIPELEKDFPVGLPPEVNAAVAKALEEPRTVEQIHDRIARRWRRYEDDALSRTGKGIDAPIAVLYALLGRSRCEANNVNCEDGWDLGKDAECLQCVEHKAEFRAAQRPAIPAQPDVAPVQQDETFTAPEVANLELQPIASTSVGEQGLSAMEAAKQAVAANSRGGRHRSARVLN